MNMTRRAALTATFAALPAAALAAPRVSVLPIPLIETGKEKIARLTRELHQALVEQEGGEWKAEVALDVGMVMIVAKA